MTFEDWLRLGDSIKTRERLENAYDLLDFHNNLNPIIPKEDIINEIMVSHFEYQLAEILR